ncbi:polyketide cyclase [Saccharibacillus sp. O16]|nr:polyketide cyclase [Saccharibacillus sp. O16]
MASSHSTLPEIRKSLILQAPIDKVWQAVATAEGLKAWWMDNTFEAMDGHEFVVRSPQFGESPCRVTELDPPSRLSIDWGKDWTLTFELEKIEEEATRFTLIHSGWDADAQTEFGQPHPIVRGIMDGGWEKIVHQNLVDYIGSVV